MIIKDALNLFGLNLQADKEDIKRAYKSMVKKYHPDLNNGLDDNMIKLINNAYDALTDFDPSQVKGFEMESSLLDDLHSALKSIMGLHGLNIELCGAWLWVSGNTKDHKDKLKSAGFFWSQNKKEWYFRPKKYRSYNRKSWSKDDIRIKYGSSGVKAKEYSTLQD